MDKRIRKLKSVEITNSRDGLYTIKYKNSVGDKIEILGKQIIISVNDRAKTLTLEDIKSVDMNPMFKKATEKPYTIIKTEKEEIELLIDTHTDEFYDLPAIYDYIRRRVVVG